MKRWDLQLAQLLLLLLLCWLSQEVEQVTGFLFRLSFPVSSCSSSPSSILPFSPFFGFRFHVTTSFSVCEREGKQREPEREKEKVKYKNEKINVKHNTSMDRWRRINEDGALKSKWNECNRRRVDWLTVSLLVYWGERKEFKRRFGSCSISFPFIYVILSFPLAPASA